MPEIPTAGAAVNKFVNPGIPLIAGFVGFASGDVFDVHALVVDIMGGTEGTLPFSSHLDYAAFGAMVPYAIGWGVIEVIKHAAFPSPGMYAGSFFRAVRWYVIGVIAHLALAGLLPSKVPVGVLALPGIAR